MKKQGDVLLIHELIVEILNKTLGLYAKYFTLTCRSYYYLRPKYDDKFRMFDVFNLKKDKKTYISLAKYGIIEAFTFKDVITSDEFGTCCFYGQVELFKSIVDRCVKFLNFGLFKACLKGHMILIDLLIVKGANNWDYGLRGAYDGGNVIAINKMLHMGANRYNYYLYVACEKDDTKMITNSIMYGATDINGGLLVSCKFNKVLACALMTVHGAKNFNEGLKCSRLYGSMEAAEFMIYVMN